MSGFPFTNVSQHYNLLSPYYSVDTNGQPVIQHGTYPQAQSFPSPVENFAFDYDDLARHVVPGQGSSRSRRRLGPGGDHLKTKFRRTRSGCYTCRNRRVKCDEGRPICERCRKGNRECNYPEPSSATSKQKRGGVAKEKLKDDDETSSPDSGSGLDFPELDLDGEPASAVSNDPNSRPGSSADEMDRSTPEPGQPKSPVITGNTSNLRSRPKTVESLSEEVRFYFNYAKENLTPHHWNFGQDESNFVSHTLFDTALQYEPLLYAVTCFGAFHHTVHRPDGQIDHFLKFHTASVKSLRESLFGGHKSFATVLTILQLATIEEVLGDWVNLLSHQKAAYQIMTELWTPEQSVRHGALRMVFKWYLHFDIFLSIFSAKPPKIPKTWVISLNNFYKDAISQDPDNINMLYEERASYLRLLTFEAIELISSVANTSVLTPDTETKAMELQRKFSDTESTFPAKLQDPSALIVDFSDCPPLDPDDVYNAHEPGLIFGGELFPTNGMFLSIAAMQNMLQTRVLCMKGLSRDDEESKALGKRIIKVFNAVRYWPYKEGGALLQFRSIFTLGVVLVPPTTEKELRWMLKQFQAIESEGYNFPQSIRSRISLQSGFDVTDRWLPNGEPSPAVFKMIRDFIAERAKLHTDEASTHLREMKGVFNTLSLSDASSPESTHSPSCSSAATRPSSDKRSPLSGINHESPEYFSNYDHEHRHG